MLKHFTLSVFFIFAMSSSAFGTTPVEQLIQSPPEWNGTTERTEDSRRYLAIMTVLNLLIAHNYMDNAVNITSEQVTYAQKAKTFDTSVKLYQEWAKNGKKLTDKIKNSISTYAAKKTSDGRSWPLHGSTGVNSWEEGHGWELQNFYFDLTALAVLANSSAENYAELFRAHNEDNPWLAQSIKVDQADLVQPLAALKKVAELGRGKDIKNLLGFDLNLEFPKILKKGASKKVVLLGQAGAESYIMTENKETASVDTELNTNLVLTLALQKKYAANKGEALEDVRAQLCGAYKLKTESDGWLKEKSKRERVGNVEMAQLVNKQEVERNVAFSQEADGRIRKWEPSYKDLTGKPFKYSKEECPEED